MRVMVTGANGFIGRVLVNRLLADGWLRGRSIEALLLFDQELEGFGDDKRLRSHIATITQTAVLRRALADGVDVVFHLAGVPGAVAEADYECGYQANLLGSLELLQQLRTLPRPPVLVYAGAPSWPAADSVGRAQRSCAVHAQMVEIALSDLARRGEVDGRALRLPPIVARPGLNTGDRSEFMSELLTAYATERAYCCPVSQDTPLTWMSVWCCVDNLICAAQIADFGIQRTCQLPALRLTPAQLLRPLGARFSRGFRALISFAPDPALEGLLSRSNRTTNAAAQAFGFKHDGSASLLIRNVFDPPTAQPFCSARREGER